MTLHTLNYQYPTDKLKLLITIFSFIHLCIFQFCLQCYTSRKVENIITDTEKKYHIYYGEYMIYTEDKDKEGIVYLILYDENKEFIFGICYE